MAGFEVIVLFCALGLPADRCGVDTAQTAIHAAYGTTDLICTGKLSQALAAADPSPDASTYKKVLCRHSEFP